MTSRTGSLRPSFLAPRRRGRPAELRGGVSRRCLGLGLRSASSPPRACGASSASRPPRLPLRLRVPERTCARSSRWPRRPLPRAARATRAGAAWRSPPAPRSPGRRGRTTAPGSLAWRPAGPSAAHSGPRRRRRARARTARFSGGDDQVCVQRGRLATVRACTVTAGRADWGRGDAIRKKRTTVGQARRSTSWRGVRISMPSCSVSIACRSGSPVTIASAWWSRARRSGAGAGCRASSPGWARRRSRTGRRSSGRSFADVERRLNPARERAVVPLVAGMAFAGVAGFARS